MSCTVWQMLFPDSPAQVSCANRFTAAELWYNTTQMSFNRYLLWLDWPIGAFRLNASGLAVFKSLVEGEVRMVRSERAFLRELPTATHAIVWAFRKAWFARAKRLRVLATPGAGRELLPTDAELPPGVVRVNGAFHGAIMSETVLAFIFAHARGLYAAAASSARATFGPAPRFRPSARAWRVRRR